jgi:murein DD-endopeptidase MepM/ murein hydrolase activator NlpD
VKFLDNFNRFICRQFPEQRLFLKSDDATRFIRLKPWNQAAIMATGATLLVWTIVATSVLAINSISADTSRDQVRRQQEFYQARLNSISQERDIRSFEAQKAHQRFYVAMDQISAQQSALLASEDRRKELETGIEVIQRTLRTTMKERDAARSQSEHLKTELASETGSDSTIAGRTQEIEETVDFLTSALSQTVQQRDTALVDSTALSETISDLKHSRRVSKERSERIFARLEEAMTVSVAPLERMFENAGVSTEKLLDDVRRGYSGTGGPLVPLSISTKNPDDNQESLRANLLLKELDRVNLYRLAAFKTPFATPVHSKFRFTSGFGNRRDPKHGGYRMHSGVDFAAPRGTPIYATADGVVKFAKWGNGYGRLIKIQHALGYETRFAHLNRIRVKEGQRVSRGDLIGDMGTTGRSTGVHLHYEVRIGGKAVNPMTYIRAAQNVF